MGEKKQNLFDKSKDKAVDFKEDTSKEDLSRGWDNTKEKGDKYAGDNDTWNSMKEEGDSVFDRFQKDG